ncbi:hypothetical protein ACFXGA_25175 [Actinosynnema sp. NPDC059335]|uniref:hypothetical protein n=1 Tax=Actinosynnema sp. NPDC059335 TaxID=3346804 RepID=UPI00366D83D6
MTRSEGAGVGLDRILFGSPPQGGVELLWSTVFRRRLEETWHERLVGLVRLEFNYNFDEPRSSLSYFAYPDSTAAVMRRVGDGQTNARNSAQVLVGPVDVLTPRQALALEGWDGWSTWGDDGAPLPPLPAPLGPAPLEHERSVAEVVAAILRKPDEPLTVVAAGPGTEVPLVRGAVELLEPLWHGSDARRRWTFSTHEKEFTATTIRLVDIAFLPGRSAEVTAVSKSVLDFTAAPPEEDWEAAAADRLVRLYREGGRAAVERVFSGPGGPSPRMGERLLELRARTAGVAAPRNPVVGSPTGFSGLAGGDGESAAGSRAGADEVAVSGGAAGHGAASVFPEVAGSPAAAGAQPGAGSPGTAGSRAAAVGTAAVGASAVGESAVGESAVGSSVVAESAVGQAPVGGRPGEDDEVSSAELVERWLVTGDPDLRRRLSERSAALTPADRVGMRHALLAPRAVDRLDALAGHRTAVALAFGAALEDVGHHAPDVVHGLSAVVADRRSSPQLVRCVVETAVRHGKLDLISPALGVRHARELAIAAPDLPWADLLCADREAHRPKPAAGRVDPLPAVTAPDPVFDRYAPTVKVVVFVLLAFLVGLVTGVLGG